jgi:hypothetical protein
VSFGRAQIGGQSRYLFPACDIAAATALPNCLESFPKHATRLGIPPNVYQALLGSSAIRGVVNLNLNRMSLFGTLAVAVLTWTAPLLFVLGAANSFTLTGTTLPVALNTNLVVRFVMDTTSSSGANSVRIAKDPRDNQLYYLKRNGDIYRVNLVADSGGSTSSNLYSANDHGIASDAQGMAIGPEGTIYLVGNVTTNGGNSTLARIMKGVPDVNNQRVWSLLAQTEPYQLSGTGFDHLYNGVVVSPDGNSIYVNCGSRTDHGEVRSKDGLYPDTREVALTAKVLCLPTSGSNLLLRNDTNYLLSAGYLFAEGTRNAFDMAFAPSGDLFAADNGPDRDMSDELNWLRRGLHYGFPWRMGGADNPQQLADYNPTNDLLLNPIYPAVREGSYFYDPAFPPAPGTFAEPVVNLGPDTDSYRDPADGQVKRASAFGQTLSTVSAHRSPLGLVFDVPGAMAAPFQFHGFLLSWAPPILSSLNGQEPMSDPSQDMLALDLTKIGGTNYQARVTRIIAGFSNPIDAEIVSNRVYVLEYRGNQSIWEITFPAAPHVNSAPELPTQANRIMEELTLLSVTNTAMDADIPANVLTYQLLDPPSGAVIDASGVITWTPSEAQGPSTNTLTTVVSDGAMSATNSFGVLVTEVNSGPVLVAPGDQTNAELTVLTLTTTATDADIPANVLIFSLEPGAPVGTGIDSTTGVFSWTPSETQGPGVYPVTVRVTDNGSPPLTDTRTFRITVNEVNVAPNVLPPVDRTVDEETTLNLTIQAMDSDVPANVLTFALDSTAPTGATIDPATGVFTWTPSEAQGPGAYTIVVRVTDDGSPPLNGTAMFSITVLEVNVAPVLAVMEDKTIEEEQELEFLVVASDADSPPQRLTYSLDAEPPAGAFIEAVTGMFSWTPNSNQASSTNVITVRVSDDGTPGLSDTHTFRVVVREKPVELRLSQVRLTGDNEISFVWPARGGRTYRAQFKHSLSESGWSDLEPVITATGATASFSQSFLGQTQRFYRVIRFD